MVFSKFIKKLQLPSEYQEAAVEVFQKPRITLTQASINYIQPGDIITFSYNSLLTSRRFLVVSTRKNPRGKFMSGRGNYLICGYDLSNKETLPGLVMIFNSFYKSNKSSYERLKNLMSSIFGGDSYKTFNVNKMKAVFELVIAQNKN
jgi:hypothetical protein